MIENKVHDFKKKYNRKNAEIKREERIWKTREKLENMEMNDKHEIFKKLSTS